MSTRDHGVNSSVPERLSAVERDVRHLSDEIGSIKSEMASGFASIRQLIGDQRTPIAQLAGWASVILVIVGAVLYPLFQTDHRLEAGLQEVAVRFVDHLDDGHPASVLTRVDANTAAIDELERETRTIFKDLDTALQREMRDLDAADRVKLDALDSKLQREMELMMDTLKTIAVENQTNIRELREWQRTVGGRLMLSDSAQDARLKNIETIPQEDTQ